MRVLVAPDKFKGTLTARQAADAIATGWGRAVPAAFLDVAPMADGGEGTLDALVAAGNGRAVPVRVRGPLGDPVDARYGLVPGPDGATAVVEMALASGLELVSPARRDPKRASTWGTGELILAACEAGIRRLVVCIGGSATNDGGAGMAQAVGVRLLDARGRDLGPGGAALLDLTTVDVSGLHPSVRGVEVIVASDVDNPLTGPSGASAVYGPQKGATGQDVLLLDRALGHLAAVLYRDLGIDVRSVPGAGAAGGLGAGLIAFLGARLRPGVEVVMEALRLEERMDAADTAVTGEGSFDRQSLHGKAAAGVLHAAELAAVPAVVLCGRASTEFAGVRVLSLVERFGEEAAMRRAGPLLVDLAAEAAAEMAHSAGRGRSD